MITHEDSTHLPPALERQCTRDASVRLYLAAFGVIGAVVAIASLFAPLLLK